MLGVRVATGDIVKIARRGKWPLLLDRGVGDRGGRDRGGGDRGVGDRGEGLLGGCSLLLFPLAEEDPDSQSDEGDGGYTADNATHDSPGRRLWAGAIAG